MYRENSKPCCLALLLKEDSDIRLYVLVLKGRLRRSVSHIRLRRLPGAMRATEEAPSHFDPMPNHFAPAMFANRGHCLDRALEAIEHMTCPGSLHNESLVILVAANFARCHGTPPQHDADHAVFANPGSGPVQINRPTAVCMNPLPDGPFGDARYAAATCGREISATVLETLSGLSFNARSAWETMPMQRPSPSTTGMRRI